MSEIQRQLKASDGVPGVGRDDYVRIEPGRFVMGSPEGETGRRDAEVAREVRITRGFYLKTTEVTQGEWRAVMGRNPSRFGKCGDDCPVEGVSWFGAAAFVNALSTREGLAACYAMRGSRGTPGGGCSDWSDGWCKDDYVCDEVELVGLDCKGYRLPTEAEWEYAARAGTTTAIFTGPLTIRGQNDGPELDRVGWYGGNSGASFAGAWDCSDLPEKATASTTCGPHSVGKKRPNAWGLYDMLGNVWEWVFDWSGAYESTPTDPLGPSSGEGRAIRGGSWFIGARSLRSANRGHADHALRGSGIGLRPARTIP